MTGAPACWRFPRRAYGAMAALLVSMNAGLAPVVQAGPLECARIDQPTARLACFDQEFPKALSAPVTAATGKWRMQSAPSAVARRTDHTLSLASQGMIECRWSDPRPVHLRMRCIGNVTSVLLETGCFMTSSQYLGYGDVSYAIDSDEAKVARMTAGADDRSLGFWSGETAIPLIRDLLGASTLTVRMTPYSDEPISAAFDVRGITEAIKPIREECGW